MMDTTRQLHALEATGWKRGVYDDVQRTFRAPIVNWIFRTAMANDPEFIRFAWAQVKPVFETRSFADLSVAYRDAVLSELEADDPLPTYRRTDAGVSPAEYAELRGQLATFDIVAPRLSVLFSVTDRALQGETFGDDPAGRASTAPAPEWLDRDRGLAPTLRAAGDEPDDIPETMASLRAFHGFGDTLPSIYRCLAQWPGALATAWEDLEPVFESSAFETAGDDADRAVEEFLAGVAYRPQLSPAALSEAGFDEETISDVQGLFSAFNRGGAGSVLPAIHAYAATVDVDGARTL